MHITGMVALRKLIMWLAGGAYDFHFSLAIVLYEFRKDVMTCVLIGGGLWLIDSRREAQRALRVVPPARVCRLAPAAVVWLRDGAKSIRIEPRDIVWIASAGNYVEYSLADGANHLIRGTLAAAESELSRFNLVRIHRTRLANLDRVTRHGGETVRRFRPDLRYRTDRCRQPALPRRRRLARCAAQAAP